jgi:hypothetical protein
MSEREAGSRQRVAGSLDAAIDRAVREMLDVEPPPGLRGRVMDRIERNDPVTSAFRRKFWLVAAPVAAAAVIVIAVMAPWRDAAPAARTSPPVVAGVETPRVTPSPVSPKKPEPPTEPKTPHVPRATSINAGRVAAPPPDRLVAAAAVAAGEDVNFTVVEALAPPPSIAIDNAPGPAPSSIRSIEPAPLQIRALEITPLPETPRERREE